MTKKILRTIAVIPAAIIASFLAYTIIGLFFYINNAGYNLYTGNEPEGITEWILTLFRDFSVGYAFVFIGCLTAPDYKKVWSIILASLLTIICIVSSILAIEHDMEWILVINIISTIIGAIAATYQIYEEEEDKVC